LIIDEILTLLKDGNWHNRSELAKKYSSNGLKVKMVISFLSKFDFVELDKKGRKVRLRSLMLEFINETQHTEYVGAEAVMPEGL
jgi:hypothetical protein